MNRSLMFLFASLLCGAVAFATGKTVYDFTMNSIDGQPVQLSAYKGKVLLLVNVASKCGDTLSTQRSSQFMRSTKTAAW